MIQRSKKAPDVVYSLPSQGEDATTRSSRSRLVEELRLGVAEAEAGVVESVLGVPSG